MKLSQRQKSQVKFFLSHATWMSFMAFGLNAHAAESYKLRQSPVGAFGGEIAAPADKPGFFGTASLTQLQIYKIADSSGGDVTPPAIPSSILPYPGYKVAFPTGTLKFNQDQTQLNVAAGYLSETKYADGHIALAVNVPFVNQKRSYVVEYPSAYITPTPSTQVAAVLAPAITAANTKVQQGVAAASLSQNLETSGLGDTEVTSVWIRHVDRLKVAAGVSLFVPTGSYDKNRGPNPGFGNFYTLRPGVAVTYNLNPKRSDEAWDSGVTIAGRFSYGINTRNKDTDYKSGNFIYAEGGFVKVAGDWAYGMNVFSIQQISDDNVAGSTLFGNRYKTNGFGPFVSFKIPGKDAGINVQYSDNFGGRNAIAVKSLQARLVKAW